MGENLEMIQVKEGEILDRYIHHFDEIICEVYVTREGYQGDTKPIVLIDKRGRKMWKGTLRSSDVSGISLGIEHSFIELSRLEIYPSEEERRRSCLSN